MWNMEKLEAAAVSVSDIPLYGSVTLTVEAIIGAVAAKSVCETYHEELGSIVLYNRPNPDLENLTLKTTEMTSEVE